MEMSKIIKSLRIERGWTQEELGEKVGLQKSAIAKYENGRVSNMRRPTIQKMAEVFGVSPAYLMGFDAKRNIDYGSKRKEPTDLQEATAYYCQLDDEDRETVKLMMGTLLAKSKYKKGSVSAS